MSKGRKPANPHWTKLIKTIERAPWPIIREYEENGHIVHVGAPAYAAGDTPLEVQCWQPSS